MGLAQDRDRSRCHVDCGFDEQICRLKPTEGSKTLKRKRINLSIVKTFQLTNLLTYYGILLLIILLF